MEKGLFNFDREKIESHYTFCRISRFFSMSLQIFLYEGLAGLYKELSTIQIKGRNIWNTSRDMMIYICINIFICVEQIVPQILGYKMSQTNLYKQKWNEKVL